MLQLSELQHIVPGITDEELRKQVRNKLSPAERREQMISFVMGTIGSKSTITREEVKQFVDEYYG